MTYKRFEHWMASYHEMLEFENKILDLFSMSPENFLSQWVDNFSNILKEYSGDKYDWIGYYVYDLNFGEKWKPGMVTTEDGTDIPLKTVEDLWNIIQDEREPIE